MLPYLFCKVKVERKQDILSTFDRHLGSFQFLAIMKKVPMNILVHVFCWLEILISFFFCHIWKYQARGRNGAAAIATAMPDPSCIRDLHCSSQQRRILNPLSEAGDRIHILMDTSWVLNLLSTHFLFFYFFVFLPFLGLFPQHMEVPRLGVQSKL